MKIKLFTITIVIFFSIHAFSQYDWYLQNSGSNRELTDVCFVDENNGWISGWTGTILHTTDGGTTWAPQTVPPTNAYYSVFFTDALNGWASGYAGIMIHTTDGGENWVSQSSTTNSDLNDLFFINADTGWAAGGRIPAFPSNIPERIILRTTDGGYTWVTQYFQTEETVLQSIFFIDSNNGYAVGGSGEIMHTIDGGNVWTHELVANGNDFRDVFFTNINTGIIVGYGGFPSYGVIYRTSDAGNSWTEIPFGEGKEFIRVYFPNDLNGWAVGNDFGGGNLGIIYHTTDGGQNWSPQSTPAIDALFNVYFINNTDGWSVGHLGTIAAMQSQVPVELTSFTARADNDNVILNWRTATETNNKGFEIERSQKSNTPAGEAGVKSQKDWKNVGFVGGHGTATQENSYTFTDKKLKPGKYSYKLVQVDLDGTRNESEVVNVEITFQPEGYVLMQNYPNPFNPSTTIRFAIPEDDNVKLEVYNSLGEKVSTLINGVKQAGSYKVIFDGTDLSSGTYFYRISAGSFVDTDKMLLIK